MFPRPASHLLFGLSMISVLSLTLPSVAQTLPTELNYQGRLTELDGTLVNGLTVITFRLYNVEVGGTHLWEEFQAIEIEGGTFSAVLGSNTPINLDFSIQYWLELEVNNDLIEPRVQLVPVPYSHYAVHAGVSDSADWAVSADEASEANHALTADSASQAEHASTADYAVSSDMATEASHALSADTAAEATHATDADYALTADEAGYADHAAEADRALDADTVGGYDAASLEESDEITTAIAAHETVHHAEDPTQEMLEVLAYNLSQLLHEDPQYEGLLSDDFEDDSLVDTGQTTAQLYTDASVVMDGPGSMYDDFDDANVDTSLWSTYTNGNGGPSVSEFDDYLVVAVNGDPWPSGEARACSKTGSNYWYMESVTKNGGSSFASSLILFGSPSASGTYVTLQGASELGDDVHVYCDPDTQIAAVFAGGEESINNVDISSLGSVSSYYIGILVSAASGAPTTRETRMKACHNAEVGSYQSSVYSSSQAANGTVASVLLTVDDEVGDGGDIQYEVSADGGSHYTSVTEGELTAIDDYRGTQVVLRATLTLGNSVTSIDNYTLYYLTE